jgi:hypothetical protein
MDPLVRDPSRLPLSHSYYDNALRVAVAIISNCGIRLQSGDGQFVVLDTLLINLDQVFERYIRNRHALHFHRIECSSWDCSIWFNAFIAMSRIASRLDFNALSVVSINSVPSADVSHSVCALHMLKRDVAVMKKDIDLDLALLSVRMKPGEALTQEDIGAWCN